MPEIGVDPLTPGTPEWDQRQRIRRHNGMHGSTEIIRRHASIIGECSTVTDEVTTLCVEIMEKCDALRAALRTRIDR